MELEEELVVAASCIRDVAEVPCTWAWVDSRSRPAEEEGSRSSDADGEAAGMVHRTEAGWSRPEAVHKLVHALLVQVYLIVACQPAVAVADTDIAVGARSTEAAAVAAGTAIVHSCAAVVGSGKVEARSAPAAA